MIAGVGMISNYCLNNHRHLIPAAPIFDITMSNSLEDRSWQAKNSAGGQVNVGGIWAFSELPKPERHAEKWDHRLGKNECPEGFVQNKIFSEHENSFWI